MTMTEYDEFPSASAERDGLETKKLLFPIDTQQLIKKDTTTVIQPSLHGHRKRVSQSLVVRAPEVLLPLIKKPVDNSPEPSPAVENFQEVLRIFPPFRDDDGALLGAVDVKCPDCEAVFSSSSELKGHYLTKFCPGAAVAVYVMTRDRLITKGYRIEKKLIPLDSRPLQFFCGKCEKLSAIDDDRKVTRHKNTPYCVDCTHCGEKCSISYDPPIGDPNDDASFRDIHKDVASSIHSRSPSIAQKSLAGSKFSHISATGGDQFASKTPMGKPKTRRFRDSWSFRKFSQSDEDELIAISFTSQYDLERVHAPHGMFQQLECSPGTSPTSQLTNFQGLDGLTGIDPKRSTTTLCEEEVGHARTASIDSEGDLLDDEEATEEPAASQKRSLFSKVFGRKLSKGLSRASSASSRGGKKLIKRANTVRFSFVSKRSRNDGDSEAEDKGTDAGNQSLKSKKNLSVVDVSDVEYIELLRVSQNIFVHVQKVADGAMVHDVSGRQRVLSMEQVGHLFTQIKDELAAATIWSRTATTRLRADTALKQGNCRAAVAMYHDALRMLDHTPALDIDRLTRAGMLHTLGQAYRSLDMPAESEGCYLEALGLYKRSLGRDHPHNFTVLHDLATLCEKDGYATEAAALYERSYAGRLRTAGQHAPETLSSMQDLAAIKVSLGDLESALFLLEKAVSALDTVFGVQNEMTLNAMNKLSILYQKLGLDKESRTISGKMIPHCKTFFGINSPTTRDTVVRYLHNSENFDFSPEIKDVLEHYRRSRDADALRVIHRLGRAYMDAGLNRDAASLFETLFEDFLAVKGVDAPETFDALSALCVSREHLDSTEKAIYSYGQLVHMARRTPEGHHSRKRIAYAEKRIADLNHRREVLAAEKKSWGLNDVGPCANCGYSTTILCSACHTFRFCSEACHNLGSTSHNPRCIPSVTLRESKSIAIKPRCPASARDQALSKIRCPDSSIKGINVIASYTYYLDPRNLATFRMKLSSNVNTVILFSAESNIRYTLLNDGRPEPHTPHDPNGQASPSYVNSGLQEIDWLTPQRQESVCYIPGAQSQSPATYLFVTPGQEMLKSIIDRRVGVRGGNGEKERFQALTIPNQELIEYVQGLLLTGYMGEAFMYVLEWVWK